MHHKFAIIDDKLLITGSANWTAQAFFGNHDNVIITNEQTAIKSYKEEFEQLWIRFSAGPSDPA